VFSLSFFDMTTTLRLKSEKTKVDWEELKCSSLRKAVPTGAKES